ncbi:MAG: hypothetical protein RLZ98_1939 [Pseudomonadota bacterium]|jgi:predicted enzyme related to lactoylglutathione lyase
MFQLSAVSVPVSDQSAARTFYEQVLGFTVRSEGDHGTEFAWILMTPPAGAAAITLVKPNSRQQAGQAQGLMLQTLDLDRVYEKLAGNGLALSTVHQANWGRFATFTDPDGNGWVIAEPSIGL